MITSCSPSPTPQLLQRQPAQEDGLDGFRGDRAVARNLRRAYSVFGEMPCPYAPYALSLSDSSNASMAAVYSLLWMVGSLKLGINLYLIWDFNYIRSMPGRAWQSQGRG